MSLIKKTIKHGDPGFYIIIFFVGEGEGVIPKKSVSYNAFIFTEIYWYTQVPILLQEKTKTSLNFEK